ncbi:hypothetical protein [Actinoplanes sp. NPDC089786]|uniref:carboxymuconolactone decarboxylase family protein n=1 Tax=Actinoplanes sp. NPDC089786 TaxID=3155185 RepID=UPI00341714BE
MNDLDAVKRVAPHVYTAWQQSWETTASAIDANLLDTLRERVNDRLEGRRGSESGDAERTLADLFVDRVADVGEDHLNSVRAKHGDQGLRNFVEALYLIDQTTRLRIAHRALLSGAATLTGPETSESTEPHMDRPMTLTHANVQWHDRILASSGIPSDTRELLRLRAARYHRCGTCSSVRLVENGRRVVGPQLEAALDDYPASDLPPAQKAALSLADAYMADPLTIDAALVAELTEHYSPADQVRLTLEVSAWNYQKVLVALKMDRPVNEGVLSALTIGAAGECRFGGPLA